MKIFNGEIEYKEKKYKLPFNMNVMEEIQEKYGSIDKWGELTDGVNGEEPNIQAIIFGLTAMINEGIEIDNENNNKKEKKLTKKQVGRMITEIGINESLKNLKNTVVESTKSDEKNA